MAGERGSAVVSAGTAVVMMLSMSMLFHCHVADAKPVTHTINPWTIQSSDLTYYNKWAANEKKFTAGDTLVFKFDKSKHNAVEVGQTGYDHCNQVGKKPTKILSGVPVKLTTGNHSYICSVIGHCGLGMKLQITVS